MIMHHRSNLSIAYCSIFIENQQLHAKWIFNEIEVVISTSYSPPGTIFLECHIIVTLLLDPNYKWGRGNATCYRVQFSPTTRSGGPSIILFISKKGILLDKINRANS